jgi:hypothetical protein
MQDITVVSMIFKTILALACLFLIISPLFKWDVYFHVSSMSQDNAATKEALLTTLNEIEFEYRMDKISHADYKNLKKQYETEVASIMKDEEQMIQSNVEKDLMDEVEKEIEAQMKTYKNKKGEGK